MKTVSHKDLYCPYCGTELNRSTDLDGDDAPKVGDLTVCYKCDALLQWTEDYQLVEFDRSKLTPEEAQYAERITATGKKFIDKWEQDRVKLDVEKYRKIEWVDSGGDDRIEYAMPNKVGPGWYIISILPIIALNGDVEPYPLILLTDKTHYQFSSLHLFRQGKMGHMKALGLRHFDQLKPFLEMYHQQIALDNLTTTDLANNNPVYGEIAKKSSYSPGKANKPLSRSQMKRQRRKN